MIYTTGYYGHQPEALKSLAATLDATVVDIRFMPASRVPGWRKQALQKLLGDRYLWVQAFGTSTTTMGNRFRLPTWPPASRR